MVQEADSRVCCYCDQDKTWVWQGKRLKDGSKIYVDKRGSRWAGRRCPDCERNRVRRALSIDSFNIDLVVRELKSQGYEVIKKKPPLMVSKQGKQYKVVIKKAYANGNNIVVEEPIGKSSEDTLIVFTFQTAKVIAPEQVALLADKCDIYGKQVV